MLAGWTLHIFIVGTIKVHVKEESEIDGIFFVGTINLMQTQRRPKRGRPPKADDRRKEDYLDIRLEAAEKQAFKDAAELAGLDLSAWVRERLRSAAAKSLTRFAAQ